MTGFIGAAITKALYNTEHELIAFVRNKEDLPEEILDRYQIIKGDISVSVPKIECDLVIHAAATVSDKVISFILNKTNVEGTRRVLEATPSHAPIIFFSTGNIYNVHEKIHEEDELVESKKITPYARSKYLSEQLIKEEFPNRNAVILRPRGVYGKGDRVILPRLLKVYKKGKLTVPGNLDYQVSMTNIELLKQVVLEFVNSEITGQHTFNVADFEPFHLRANIQSLFSALFKRDIEIIERNEPIVRIIGGLRQVLVPGNLFTQTAIDYLTKNHVISTEKLQNTFPNLSSKSFSSYVPEYVEWINSIGLAKIVSQDKEVVWL